jgi:UV DNA damage endonuclease
MRIGFACKFVDTDLADYSKLNFKSTTARHLSSLSPEEARIKLTTLCKHNLSCLSQAAELLGSWPEPLRMFRMSGDVFPLFTHEVCHRFYARELYPELREELAKIGQKFRDSNTRVSFHPGQFTLLGTAKEGTLEASIQELEYHTLLLLDLGYSGWHDHGCAINIHGGSKSVGLSVVRRNLERLTPECRDFLTIENDEFSYGLKQLTEELGDVVAILPDLHHEWIYRGDYMQPEDTVLSAVEQSWRGVRPKMHCAFSRQEYMFFKRGTLEYVEPPERLETLREVMDRTGATRSELRQHGDTIWHPGAVRYYEQFTDRFDLMVEAKSKHTASLYLAQDMRAISSDTTWPSIPENLRRKE